MPATPFHSIAVERARSLIDSPAVGQATSPSRANKAANACNHLHNALSRWVGRDGCHALFVRALAEARAEHALLEEIALRPGAEPYVEGVGQIIITHGDDAAAKGLETMLIALFELLARLIGDDMATKLIDQASAELPTSRTNRSYKEKEA
jgi:hypothetical protein